MKTIIASIIVLMHFGIKASESTSNSDVIIGEWYSDTKDGKIEIFKKGDKYYGKLVWIKNENVTDWQNPNPKLRSQKILGLTILKDFSYNKNSWDGGTIYDPNSGKTYSCFLKLNEKNELVVRGYIGVSFIGRSSIWTRATKP
ncbi:MAG: DUF2147 domain-containing protein [Arcicella sp.]|jgi:uncharacterized protein (DUF2147 family)|nr:DUF2147 domain-containing protein [Arcicella sp.]